MTDFKVGDKIAAAVRTGNNNPALRVGVIERIHERTYSIGSRRFTIRDKDGKATVVSEDRAVRIDINPAVREVLSNMENLIEHGAVISSDFEEAARALRNAL